MRKNGINKELVEIEGGVCAPLGFCANATVCGILNGNKEDLALIASERRVPTACVFSKGGILSPSVTVTQKHLKSNRGQAQAILLNGGVANFSEVGETLAENACRSLERKAQISRDEIIVISTGKIGEVFPSTAYLQGIERLAEGLNCCKVASQKVARTIAPTAERARQKAFSFLLGDTPCKIGAVFQKGIHNEKTPSGLVCCLTTDVCITFERLQKALASAVRESFDLLCVDGAPSPCDTVCIMASGKAGNYKISDEDTEYDKFRYFLTEALKKICFATASVCSENKAFSCRVEGAKSARLAKTVAKALAYSQTVKRIFSDLETDAEGILCELHAVSERIVLERLSFTLKSSTGEAVLFEDGKCANFQENALKRIVLGESTELFVRLGRGNYTASAIGVF
ncbi:MAG: hypothetical protein E7381_02385 [Clostridiales bacterium]|nr:hypothetical protein [Clostridiales bacterium]